MASKYTKSIIQAYRVVYPTASFPPTFRSRTTTTNYSQYEEYFLSLIERFKLEVKTKGRVAKRRPSINSPTQVYSLTESKITPTRMYQKKIFSSNHNVRTSNIPMDFLPYQRPQPNCNHIPQKYSIRSYKLYQFFLNHPYLLEYFKLSRAYVGF